MALKKQFLKSKPVCKVTFELPIDKVQDASEVAVVGTFNNWDASATLLKKQKNGLFKGTFEFPVGESVEFRYLADGNSWFNEEEADSFKAAGVADEQNCVIEL
jgi:1,4-alpha-glucan branching enzyme